MKKKEETELKIEDSLEELSKILDLLETEKLDLDKAFVLYEKAVHLSRNLKTKLDFYEKKIKIFSEESLKEYSIKMEDKKDS